MKMTADMAAIVMAELVKVTGAAEGLRRMDYREFTRCLPALTDSLRNIVILLEECDHDARERTIDVWIRDALTGDDWRYEGEGHA